MNTAASRSAARLGLCTRQLATRRCLSSATYTPLGSGSSASTPRRPAEQSAARPQRPSKEEWRDRGPSRDHKGQSKDRDSQVRSRSWSRPDDFSGSSSRTKPKSKAEPQIVPDTIAPQLSPDEINAIYSQELFVFRCDVTATQIPSAMVSYTQLSDLGVLTANDISNLARQIHARFRIDKDKKEMLGYITTIIEDLKSNKIACHPLASVHLLSCLKDMEEYKASNDFWEWLLTQDENYCDARTYGAGIECLAYQGVALKELEELWEQALDRYSTTTVTSVAINTGRGVPVMLFQGIITARLFHGNWRAAYEAFDVCTRLYPTLTPARIYELFIYERPVKEAYIVFLMACRAGTPPKPGVLTPLLKEIWIKTRDARAMIRLVYSFVGAGGKPSPFHLNSLVGGILGSFPANLKPKDPEFKPMYAGTLDIVRSLISARSFHQY